MYIKRKGRSKKEGMWEKREKHVAQAAARQEVLLRTDVSHRFEKACVRRILCRNRTEKNRRGGGKTRSTQTGMDGILHNVCQKNRLEN